MDINIIISELMSHKNISINDLKQILNHQKNKKFREVLFKEYIKYSNQSINIENMN